jgi:hypothetical protein
MSLVAPSKSIQLIGSPCGIQCIANYIALELLASRQEDDTVDSHQERLERVYLENDILFNPHLETFEE